MKTEFELENLSSNESSLITGNIKIMGAKPKSSPYVVIEVKEIPYLFIKDKDLELFAINILKALNSKRLKK